MAAHQGRCSDRQLFSFCTAFRTNNREAGKLDFRITHPFPLAEAEKSGERREVAGFVIGTVTQ